MRVELIRRIYKVEGQMTTDNRDIATSQAVRWKKPVTVIDTVVLPKSGNLLRIVYKGLANAGNIEYIEEHDDE